MVRQRGGFHLPPLAIATVVLYTVGYFLRLAVMTHSREVAAMQRSVRGYFVEEKLIALPHVDRGAGARVSSLGLGNQAGELAWGFTQRVDRSGVLAAVRRAASR